MSSIIYFNTEKIKKYKGVDCILNGYFFNKDNFTKIMVNNKDVTDKTLFMGTTKNKDDIYIVLFLNLNEDMVVKEECKLETFAYLGQKNYREINLLTQGTCLF